MSYDAIWRWPPDWSRDVIEQIEYLTDVQETRSGAEARRRIRTDPRRSVEYTTIQLDSGHPSAISRYDSLHQMQAELWGNDIDRWLIPLWWDVADAVWDEQNGGFFGGDIGRWRDWNDDGYTVFESGGQWFSDEVVLVENGAVFVSSMVDLEDGTSVRIYPAYPAAIHADQTFDRPSTGVSRLEVRADFIDYVGPEPLEFGTYQQRDVLLERYDRSTSSTSTQSRITHVVDFSTGRVEYYDDAGRPYVDHDLTYTFRNKADIWEIRRWLQHLGGEHRDFWTPTYDTDLDVVGVDGSTLIVEPIGWSEHYAGDLGRQHIYLDTEMGLVIGEVTSAEIIDGLEHIEIAAPIPVDADGIKTVSWLERRRLASDTITFDWIRPHIAQIDLPQRMISETL